MFLYLYSSSDTRIFELDNWGPSISTVLIPWTQKSIYRFIQLSFVDVCDPSTTSPKDPYGTRGDTGIPIVTGLTTSLVLRDRHPFKILLNLPDAHFSYRYEKREKTSFHRGLDYNHQFPCKLSTALSETTSDTYSYGGY